MKSARPLILVVDDDDTIREFITLVLADEGYDILTASEGATALKLAAQCTPDLILLDMRMPIMDGWQFAKLYAQLPNAFAPIIVLTAATDAAAFAAQIAAQDFLAKPFDLDELLQTVARYIHPV